MKVSDVYGAQSASGSLGGITASHNRGGMYLKGRKVPTNPRTARQDEVRLLMANLMVLWSSTLTQAQRDAWNLYGSTVQVQDRLGNLIHLTGVNHFVRSNLCILQAGGTRVDAGPTTMSLPATDPAFAVSISAATQDFSVIFTDTDDIWDVAANLLILYGGSPQSEGVDFFNGPWRYAGVFEGDDITPPTSPQTIATPFVATEGQKIWTYARIALADGRITNPFRCEMLVAA